MPSHDSPKQQRGEGQPASKVTTEQAEKAAATAYDSTPYPIQGKRNGAGSS